MILNYFPNEKVNIDGFDLIFGESRDVIRANFLKGYKDAIHQKRDIYKNVNSTENYFFLNYTKDDLLSEVEVHYCDQIKVYDTSFNFSENLDDVAKKLDKYSTKYIKKEGQYFFEELKIVISSDEQMGGTEKKLGYFYCALDVTHLIEN